MSKKFELEKRALIESKNFEKIVGFLNKNAKKGKTFRRFSIVFWDHSELEPSMASPYDFRVRITKNKGLFTLKYGDWRGGGREEYEFHFDALELSSVLNLMRVLGYKWGTTTYVERKTYKYKDSYVTLDKYLDDRKGILEIEIEVKNKKDFKLGEKKIDQVFSFLKIKPLTKKDFVKFIVYTNNKKDNFFDLSKGVAKYLRLWEKKFN